MNALSDVSGLASVAGSRAPAHVPSFELLLASSLKVAPGPLTPAYQKLRRPRRLSHQASLWGQPLGPAFGAVPVSAWHVAGNKASLDGSPTSLPISSVEPSCRWPL